jgi:TolA-binding protein
MQYGCPQLKILSILACAALAAAVCAQVPKVLEDPELLAGKAALADGFYELAQTKFERFISREPSPARKGEASVYLAETLIDRGKAAEALGWLEQHGDWAEAGGVEDAFLFWRAAAAYELDRHAQAASLLDSFEKTYARSPYKARALRLKALSHREAGQLEKSLETFESLRSGADRTPQDPANLLDEADLLIRLGRGADAGRILEELAARHAGTEAARAGTYLLGTLKMKAGSLDAAEGLLRKVASDPASAAALRVSAWYSLGELGEARGDLPAAGAAYEQGEALAPGPELKIEGRIRRARTLSALGKKDDAVALLEELVQAMPSSPAVGGALLEIGQIRRSARRFDSALEAYQKYLEAFSDPQGQARALAGKGWCLWDLGRYAEAAATFEKAYAQVSEPEAKETVLIKAADSYFANGQYKSARDAYARALSEFAGSPRSLDTGFQIAECLARLGQHKEAEKEFRRLMALGRGGGLAVRSLMRIAQLREELQDWEGASRVYSEAVVSYPGSESIPAALQGRALAQYRLGEFAKALADFELLLADFPGTPWAEHAFFMRAWCLYLDGKTAEALRICAEFLERYPGSEWAPDVSFWLAEHSFNQGDFAEAEKSFRGVAETFPKSAMADDALYWAGRSAAAAKEFRRAISTYNELAKSYTNSAKLAEARFAQGDALTEIGEFSGAILAFDEVARKYADSPLADLARGRKADCQFTLGKDHPDRYEEALSTYRAVFDSPTASDELKMQAEFKMGRCYERLGRKPESFEHYMNVAYKWIAARAEGGLPDPIWFTRAAFSAAALMEAEQKWDEALTIYEHVLKSGLPAGADARKRMEKIRQDRLSQVP